MKEQYKTSITKNHKSCVYIYIFFFFDGVPLKGIICDETV